MSLSLNDLGKEGHKLPILPSILVNSSFLSKTEALIKKNLKMEKI